jgi:DNA invertase Pin-like site-specific DNA recombinase
MQREKTPMLIGYARTSTEDQEAGLEAQIRDLKAAGVEEEHIFHEKISSVDANRPKFKEAMKFMRKGDTFVVAKLDRLARSILNYAEIQAELEKKGVGLRILNLGVDTSTPTGRLIHNTLMGVAQFEREMMLERQREGIAKAKRDGKYMGRKPTAREKAAEVKALAAEGLGPVEIAERLNISRISVWRILNGKDEEKMAERVEAWKDRKDEKQEAA